MKVVACLRQLMQAFKAENMLVQWTEQATTGAERRVDKICDVFPPFHDSLHWVMFKKTGWHGARIRLCSTGK